MDKSRKIKDNKSGITYDSISECARANNVSVNLIWKVANGKVKKSSIDVTYCDNNNTAKARCGKLSPTDMLNIYKNMPEKNKNCVQGFLGLLEPLRIIKGRIYYEIYEEMEQYFIYYLEGKEDEL